MIAAPLKSATHAACGAAVLLAVLLLGACSKPAEPAGGPPEAAPVSVAAAVQRTVSDSYEFTDAVVTALNKNKGKEPAEPAPAKAEPAPAKAEPAPAKPAATKPKDSK